MSQPTDEQARSELRSAGRLFAALAAAFVAVTATSIAAAARTTTVTEEAVGQGPAVQPVEVTTTSTTAPKPSHPDAIEVKMGEFFFAPRGLSVPVGVPVTLLVTNPGVVDHELVIGDAHAQDEAEEAMRSASGHTGHGANGHHGDAVPSIYLRPGESGELTVTFSRKGELLIGCHIPGHWAAGMQGTLAVG